MDVVPTPNKNMWTETMFTSHSVQTRCQGPCEMNRSEDSSVMTGTGSRFGGRRLRVGATQKMGGGDAPLGTKGRGRDKGTALWRRRKVIELKVPEGVKEEEAVCK